MWEANVDGVGAARLLTGVSILREGEESARVRVRNVNAGSSIVCMAFGIGDDRMAVAFNPEATNMLDLVWSPNGRPRSLELHRTQSQLRVPRRQAALLLGIDADALAPDDLRWLRQAVLFITEADTTELRSERIDAMISTLGA